MKLILTRFKEIKDGTIGSLTDDKGIQAFYVLEPAGPDTIQRNTDRRVPQGLYQVDYHNSPKFGSNSPRLSNGLVPKDRYILIHTGNYPKDTEGCLIVGLTYDDMGVYKSKIAMQKLREITKKQEFEIEIINDIQEKYND